MSSYALALVDVAHVQEYIFGSNDLQQNIGASELVAQATSAWVFEALNQPGFRHNVVQHNGQWQIRDTPYLADRTANVEVAYAGGGNAVVLFADADHCKAFVRALTRRALRDAPGLDLQVGVDPDVSIEWAANDGALKTALDGLRHALSNMGAPQPASLGGLGVGVTASCSFSGLPGYAHDREGSLISRPIYTKLVAAKGAMERLHRDLFQVRDRGYGFIYDFDQFGSKGDSSYIAIIHADGNGMGARLNNPSVTGGSNLDFLHKRRRFSEAIAQAANEALQRVVIKLMDSIENGCVGGEVPLVQMGNQRPLLPFRPIVFGGDDVTFVTDGRLGLILAAEYLTALQGLGEDFNLPDDAPLQARAGVAIAHTHYPFSRTYALSESLCKSAKKALVQGDYALDWHIATAGPIRELDEIRKREYTDARSRSLLMRPVTVGPRSTTWRTWEVLWWMTNTFKHGDRARQNWAGRRNKLLALRDALRAGEDAVRNFLANYEIDLPAIPGQPDMSEAGWVTYGPDDAPSYECGYWDAIEATNWFVQLTATGSAVRAGGGA